jgi:TRAP-type mannitol/chloroaromatic compound transport system permease small subunit
VYLLMPSGIALLLMQSLSELIKRIAFLSGLIPDPLSHIPAESAAAPATPADSPEAN